MRRCPLYHVVKLNVDAAGIGSVGQEVITSRVPVCDHHHSPAPRNIAPHVVDGDKILTCGGDLDRCQISIDLRGNSP